MSNLSKDKNKKKPRGYKERRKIGFRGHMNTIPSMDPGVYIHVPALHRLHFTLSHCTKHLVLLFLMSIKV